MTPTLAINLAILFVSSLFLEGLNAVYLNLRDDDRYILASIVSFIHNLMSWAVSIWFVVQVQQNAEHSQTAAEAFVCSFGGALGGFMAMRGKNRRPPAVA